MADESKFAHFREALSRGVEVALESHFGDLDTAKKKFAKWVDDGKFRMAIHVRKIPAVFNNEEAKNAFLNGEVSDIEEAVRLIPATGAEAGQNLDEANIEEMKPKVEEDEDRDDLHEMAIEFVAQKGKASTSMIQRKFRIGYNRAARLIDALEEEGVIGPADGAKPRKVFVKPVS